MLKCTERSEGSSISHCEHSKCRHHSNPSQPVDQDKNKVPPPHTHTHIPLPLPDTWHTHTHKHDCLCKGHTVQQLNQSGPCDRAQVYMWNIAQDGLFQTGLMREGKTKIKWREKCQMDGIHTFKRLERGGFPTLNMGRLAGVCVCVCVCVCVFEQVHRLCRV